MKTNILIIHLILVSSLTTISSFAKEKRFRLESSASVKEAQSIFTENSGDGFSDVLLGLYKDNKSSQAVLKINFTKIFKASRARGVEVVRTFLEDIDGDGLTDVLAYLWEKGGSPSEGGVIVWYRNLGEGNFSSEKKIHAGTQWKQSSYLMATDVDGDGLTDVLMSYWWAYESEVVWYKNLGEGKFSSQWGMIRYLRGYINQVFVIDLDGDGLRDLLLNISEDDLIWNGKQMIWRKNLGNDNFGPEKIINAQEGSISSIFAIDLNGDDLPDVLAAFNGGRVVWHENLGEGKFSPEKRISPLDGTLGAESVFAIDLDNDGFPEVFSGGSKISWYKNGFANFVTTSLPKPLWAFMLQVQEYRKAAPSLKLAKALHNVYFSELVWRFAKGIDIIQAQKELPGIERAYNKAKATYDKEFLRFEDSSIRIKIDIDPEVSVSLLKTALSSSKPYVSVKDKKYIQDLEVLLEAWMSNHSEVFLKKIKTKIHSEKMAKLILSIRSRERSKALGVAANYLVRKLK